MISFPSMEDQKKAIVAINKIINSIHEITKRGIIYVLRNGVKIYLAYLNMFYLTPTENNTKQRDMHEKNIFSVTRQLRYFEKIKPPILD